MIGSNLKNVSVSDEYVREIRENISRGIKRRRDEETLRSAYRMV